MIEAVDVHKSFQSGDEVVEALRGVTFRVGAGSCTFIVGPSGSGKSTLLYLLGALDLPTSGTIHVAGHDITTMSEPERDAYRRDRVGFVYQSFNLIGNLSAVDNVLLPYIPAGVTPELRSKAADLLKEVGLGHRMKLRPRQMSGGEQQRVAIARALIKDPIVIFADEPTGNLDRAGGDRIIQLLRDRQRQGNRTLVIVTHDRRFITRDDIVLEIEDGRLKGEPSASSSLAGAAT
jgi:putative ABC transport system ATP-binding protein